MPEDFSHCLPYRYGFGVNQDEPARIRPDGDVPVPGAVRAAWASRSSTSAPARPTTIRTSSGLPPIRLPTVTSRPKTRSSAWRGRSTSCASSRRTRPRTSAGRHGLQLPAGISAARGAVRAAQRLGGHRRHRAHGAVLPDHARRRDRAGDTRGQSRFAAPSATAPPRRATA